jgi:transposase
METWETFTMSRKEVPRAGLLKAALAGKISNAQGAQALHLSVRQFQRLKVRFTAEGARGLLHGLRGRPSPRRLAATLHAHAAALLQAPYAGLNDCHATEKLREVEGVPISRSSVRRLRRALGLPAKRRRRGRQVRTRRTPEAQRGALVQLDASPFAWLRDGGPRLALHGAIDDATGTGLALYLRPTEDLHGYVALLEQLCTRYGLPLTLYHDRLNVFVRNDAHWTLEEELRGSQDPTHFGRILCELGIGCIPAGSPQAKGRIERYWQTLQDRLVSELRLRGIDTIEGANAFFPEFLADLTARFARAPADAATAWRHPPRDLAAILSCRYARVVAHDNTVRLGPRWLQLPRQRSYAGRRIELRECFDGRLLAFADGACLATQPAPTPEFVLRPRRQPSSDRARRRRGSPSPVVEGDRYPPPSRNRSFSPRPRSAAAARTPSPTHPWRHAAPYSSRTGG